MRPGIFETVFERPTLSERFRAVAGRGFTCVQFDPGSASLDPWSGEVARGASQAIGDAAREAGIRIAAVSGTYNMAHPDQGRREAGHQGLARTIRLAAELGSPFVTVCTGTRDEDSMWRAHPGNVLDDAWTDMVESITKALEVARALDITLLVEPEPANVVSSAARARMLLGQLADDRLKIVLDPANIVLSDRSREPDAVLRESFALLGPDIAFAHAKDLAHDGQFCAAGSGIVPWNLYWDLLQDAGYDGDVIFHTLTENDIDRALHVSPWRPGAD